MFSFRIQYITGISLFYCIAFNTNIFSLPLHMQDIITLYDFILLPFYLLLFYLIIIKKSKKYQGEGLKKIFIIAFILRMVGSISYSLLIQYYYGYGDTFGYYEGGNVIAYLLHKDISSLRYLFASGNEIIAAAKSAGYENTIPVSMPNDSNLFVMKMSALISFFSFNKYLVISVFFGFFSFIGIWKLFYVFYHLNNKKHVKLLAFFVLYFPSLWFWGSGLLKEPICIGALGIIIYWIYKTFVVKTFSFGNTLLLLIMVYALTVVKNYITVLIAISLLLVLAYHLISMIKNLFFRGGILLISFLAVYIILDNLDFDQIVQNFIDNAFKHIETFQYSYQAVQDDDERSKATFMISNLSPSLGGLIANMPTVIGSCLFRPFPWEARKIIIFISSLEAMFALLVTLYILIKTYFVGFFKYVFNNKYVLFCFIFSLLFALLIGYTTFNFGTMVRYKIIFLPFYFFTLIYVYSCKKESSVDT